MTALMLAARKGSLEIVKKLTQHGANETLTNKVNPKIDELKIIILYWYLIPC